MMERHFTKQQKECARSGKVQEVIRFTIHYSMSRDFGQELLALNLSCLAVSLMCVVSSVLLLVGLTVDNRLLLLPWVVSISAATLLELTACFYHIPDVIKHPWLATLFCVDLLFCLLCVYCILCVISQYQQYLSGRGRAGQTANCPPIPIVQFQPSSCPSQPLASISGHVAQRGGGLLAVPSSSVSPQHTDLSSVSDDPSSSRGVVYHVG
ncbi:hypothetical protein CDAR_419831 [Caerostris darwini]|uniref:Uncharacterized protein n=1 Tax=Caerostris darwini TaxID=1538125 RepID=A0AAV4UGV4_9ARAC|nr:hypothetical protein CDAR_419831 [Caerostris darwini]